jgi:methionyl-tRNA formyltransferase
MRLVFAGTPAAALPSLERLATFHEVAAVITRNDAELGRKRVLTPSPVAARAAELGLETLKANRLDETITARVGELSPDLGVIVAYGGLVREPLLSTPRLGWINLHFSLLPRWRGAAPVQRAIEAGDAETGACVFQLVAALDAGDVFGTVRRPIGPDETAGELLSSLALEGAVLLETIVDSIQAGTATATAQNGDVTIASKVTLDDARLRWAEPVGRVYARLRSVTPEPGAFTTIGGDRFKILAARPTAAGQSLLPGEFAGEARRVVVGTASAPLELLEVQPAGKRPMAAADWWRGLPTDVRGSVKADLE